MKVPLKPGLYFWSSPWNRIGSVGSIKSISKYGFRCFMGFPPEPISPERETDDYCTTYIISESPNFFMPKPDAKIVVFP
jgi:hypothetical protein